ncbi:MAG TPA: hypothetical protein VFV43_12215, partial [Limnobacter sp.]|nr:hypothetical protein [Limnobacter sp.]
MREKVNRRAVLRFAGASMALGGVGALLPGFALASNRPIWLDLQRKQQRLRINLAEDDGYAAAAWMLRDIRQNNTIGVPDWQLLIRLAALQQSIFEHRKYSVFEITSGLRTSASNEATEGAAHHSNHLPDAGLRFSAVDFRPLGLPLEDLH